MEELKLEDTVLAPKDKISLTYSGAEPLQAANAIKGILMDALQLTIAGIFDELTSWSALDGSFKRVIKANKKLDNWTSMNFEIEVEGKQDLKTRNGKAGINIKPIINTTVPYSNVFQRLLWDSYARMFYYKKRLGYMSSARESTEAIKNSFIEKLGMKLA